MTGCRHYLTILSVIICILISGCVSSQQSTSSANIGGSKTSDLNIGDTATLSAPNGGLISVRVINFTESKNEKNWYIVGYEVKNIGDKAISGDVVHYWITNWAGVKDDSAGGIPRPVWEKVAEHSVGTAPFYPGDSATIIDGHPLSEKSLEGKITFYYKIGDNTASWIVKKS